MAYAVSITSRVVSIIFHFFSEQECCDGSDERPGVCVNRCNEIGEIYRKQKEAELKLRRTVINFIYYV